MMVLRVHLIHAPRWFEELISKVILPTTGKEGIKIEEK
jgi:hypothetical protein